MKILFVSMVAFESNTSATIGNKSIIKGLVKLGHSVDIMTLRPNKSAFSFDDTINDISMLINKAYYIEIDAKYKKLMAKKEKSNKVTSKINKKNSVVKLILIKGRNILKSIYNNISIFDAQKVNVKGVSKIDIDYNKYDIIISSSDPKSSHLIVDRIFRENKICNTKWIQYWGDPMLNDITRKSDWRDVFVKYHEKKLIQNGHRIMYVSPLTLDIQKKTFSKFADKMDYANQVSENLSNKANNLDMILDRDIVHVGYFGAYKSTVRNIMPLYNAALNGKFILNICGSSDILLSSIDNISIHGMLPYIETKKMEEESDILVCICNNRGTQIPGKIYYSSGYSKPIIVILDGEYKEYLRSFFSKFDRFILCENDKNSILEAIDTAKLQLNNAFKLPKELTAEHMVKKILGCE